MRGNRTARRPERHRAGTIPAGAGEPIAQRGQTQCHWDHPRGCGGTREWPRCRYRSAGPSPRVRGNLDEASDVKGKPGTIPAGAGEPNRHASACDTGGDHPRGCGGTAIASSGLLPQSGPSPRVRGNRAVRAARAARAGTIPAGAGEPRLRCRCRRCPGDHPRGCGGTCEGEARRATPRGPSPRVRGNHARGLVDRHLQRTIPAGAGEPGSGRVEHIQSGDHPRGCGGTASLIEDKGRPWGPSPRVRGNRWRRPRERSRAGTIPAGAGEPTRDDRLSGALWDHPRGCGGTARWNCVTP